MSGELPHSLVAPGRRRCRRRTIDPGSPRASELLRAFSLAGLLSIGAAALAAVADAITGADHAAGMASLTLAALIVTLTVAAVPGALAVRALAPARVSGS